MLLRARVGGIVPVSLEAREAPIELPWHCSDRHLPEASEPDEVDSGDHSPRARPAAAGPSEATRTAALDPLWKRIVTGQSLGWRYRRLRNRLRGKRRRFARALLRRLQANRSIRRTARRDSPVTRIRALVAGRRPRTVDDELRLPLVVVPPADDPQRTAELEPLVHAGRPGPDSIEIVLRPTELVTVTASPSSYRLGHDGRWLAAYVPHEHPPIGFAARGEAATVRLDRFSALAANARRRTRLVAAARRYRAVDCSFALDDPIVTARLIVDLAGAGAVLVASRVPDDVATLLGPELTATIESGPGEQLADPRVRERHSIALRRLVHRDHSVYAALAAIAGAHGHDCEPWPSVSILMSTNRPEQVVFAVEQMARQDYHDVEILCGLHDVALDGESRERIRAVAPDAQLVEMDGDLDLGQVLALLGRRASGALVTKWDDDDWYTPQHLRDLVTAMRYSGAGVVGKAAEYVYLSSLDLTMRRFATGAESFSTTIAGGTLMLTHAMLDAIGGWPSGPRRVDRLLIEAVQETGAPVYRLHGSGYLLRRDTAAANHTWQVEDDYFLAQSVEQRPGLDLEFAGVAP